VFRNHLARQGEDRIQRDEDGVGMLALHCGEGAVDLADSAGFDRQEFNAQGWSRLLRRLELQDVPSVGRVEQDGDLPGIGSYGLEQLEALADRFLREIGKPGDVAAGVREAGDEAGANRIGDIEQYDRDRGGRLLGRLYRRRSLDDDDFRAEPHQPPALETLSATNQLGFTYA